MEDRTTGLLGHPAGGARGVFWPSCRPEGRKHWGLLTLEPYCQPYCGVLPVLPLSPKSKVQSPKVHRRQRIRALIWLQKCQGCRAVFFPIFHGSSFTFTEWPAEWAGAALTTVDHADIRESTQPGGCSYHQTTVRVAALPLSRHEGQLKTAS